VRVNNDEKLHLTGLDNCQLAGTDWNGFAFQMGNNAKVGDLYVNDGSGDDNNGFRGDTRVDVHLVDGPGDVAEWDPSGGSPAPDNYENVDEAVASEADYNSSDTVDETDLYAIEALKNSGGPSLLAQFYLLKTDAGACGVDAVLKIGSTEYPHADGINPSTSGLYYPRQYDVSPAPPNAAFSESEFNALQVGVNRTE
jgi:hypothetical protein